MLVVIKASCGFLEKHIANSMMAIPLCSLSSCKQKSFIAICLVNVNTLYCEKEVFTLTRQMAVKDFCLQELRLHHGMTIIELAICFSRKGGKIIAIKKVTMTHLQRQIQTHQMKALTRIWFEFITLIDLFDLRVLVRFP